MKEAMETEKILTEGEQAIVDNLKGICEEELVFEKRMKAEKGSTVARSAGPAVEALRSFCGTDKDLAEYINLLTEKVKEKIENGEVKFEREAIEQIYEELSEDIKEAFKNSAEKEVERQKESQSGEISATMEFPPENLFGDLLVELLERQREKQNPPLENLKETKNEISGKVDKEVGEIKRGDQRINSSLHGDNSLEANKIREEGGGIVDKAVESGDKAKEEIDEIVDGERADRIKEWEEEKDSKKKKKEIEDYKAKLEAENLLAEGESIEDRIKELREEVTKLAKEEGKAAVKLGEQLSVADSKLEGIGQEEARKAISDLAENAKNNLNVAKLDYLLRTEEDLMSTHKDKEITIENLEEMANDLENLENFLVEFKRMSDADKKEAQKEIKAYYEVVKKLMKDPKVLGILIASGVLLGLAALFLATGMPVPEALGITAEQAALGIALGVSALGTGVVGGYLFSNKEQRERLKEYGKIAAGGVIGAGILGLGWLLNEEKWDKFMRGASKESYPAWYHFFKELFGLPKEGETSKS